MNEKVNNNIDTLHLVKMMNEQDKKIAFEVGKKNLEVSKAIDLCVQSILNGGKVIYAGAGTPGRLGILDASEMYPTYGNKNWIKAIIAGGSKAIANSIEDSEDSKSDAIKDLKSKNLTSKDVVIGITSSGSTPYTVEAVKYAKTIDAKTICITTTANSIISKHVNVIIDPIVGPEIILGSTRMKSGSAQKFILNMISTGIMIKMDRTWGNIMINVLPGNIKLVNRSIGIISEITGLTKAKSKLLFEKSKKDIKTSLVMHFLKVNNEKSKRFLTENNHVLKTLFIDKKKLLNSKEKILAKKALIKLESNCNLLKINYFSIYKYTKESLEIKKEEVFKIANKTFKKIKKVIKDKTKNINIKKK